MMHSNFLNKPLFWGLLTVNFIVLDVKVQLLNQMVESTRQIPVMMHMGGTQSSVNSFFLVRSLQTTSILREERPGR